MTPDSAWHWYAEFSAVRQNVDFYATKKIDADRISIITNVSITVEQHNPAMVSSPSLSFRVEEAQQIMDELWRVGIRPNNGEGGDAQIEAIRAHLQDMRRLAFNGEK